MIGARQFALMQPHAFFITTARGFIHDEAALFDALRDKRIAGAGLDVWDKEPPPPDHPLLQFDNVLASPHTAGVTKEARVNMGKIAAEQILDALDGKRPPRIVNPEVWPAYAKRFETHLRICAEIAAEREHEIANDRQDRVTFARSARSPEVRRAGVGVWLAAGSWSSAAGSGRSTPRPIRSETAGPCRCCLPKKARMSRWPTSIAPAPTTPLRGSRARAAGRFRSRPTSPARPM